MNNEIVKTILTSLISLSTGAIFAYIIAIPKKAKQKQEHLIKTVQDLSDDVKNLKKLVEQQEKLIEESLLERKVIIQALFGVLDGLKKAEFKDGEKINGVVTNAHQILKQHIIDMSH